MMKLSRSAVELSLKCKRCFVLQYKHRVSLRMLPFTLNSAVDNLCKNEFDHYREKKEKHPLFEKYDIDAIPFAHPEMDAWRDFRQGISYTDHEKGYKFYGAVDDVWVKPDGELIISDVKSTSKKVFDWNKTWEQYEYPKGYRRQLEMYQWLFKKNGFRVSNTGYLVYYNGLKDEPMFDQVLKFELHLVELECDSTWVENAILAAQDLLLKDEMPMGSYRCDTCQYLKKRWNVRKK